jgi:hypothetical protein
MIAVTVVYRQESCFFHGISLSLSSMPHREAGPARKESRTMEIAAVGYTIQNVQDVVQYRALSHMLKALGPIPSTAKMEKNQ